MKKEKDIEKNMALIEDSVNNFILLLEKMKKEYSSDSKGSDTVLDDSQIDYEIETLEDVLKKKNIKQVKSILFKYGIEFDNYTDDQELISYTANVLRDKEFMKKALVVEDPKTLKDFYLNTLSSNVFFKHQTGILVYSFTNIADYCYINELGYVVIPEDIKKIFNELYDERFIKLNKDVHWIKQCVFYSEFMYQNVIFELVLKMAQLKKDTYISKKKLEEVLTKYLEFEVSEDSNEEIFDFDSFDGYFPTLKEIRYFGITKAFKSAHYDNLAKYIAKNYKIEKFEVETLLNVLYAFVSGGASKEEFVNAISDRLEIKSDEFISDPKLTKLMDLAFMDTRLVRLKGYKINEVEECASNLVN